MASSFYPQWPHIRRISVANPPSVTGYQVQVTVLWMPGMKDDFSDIRFSDYARTLPYWIETYTSRSSATVWVKLTETGEAAREFYLYYGNGAATSESSGTNVFEFFDDFDGTSLDTSKWTDTSSTGTRTISNSIYHVSMSGTGSPTHNVITAKTDTNDATVITCARMRGTTQSQDCGVRLGIKSSGTDVGAKLCLQPDGDGPTYNIRPLNEQVAWGDILQTYSLSTWYIFEIRHDYSSTFYYRVTHSGSWHNMTMNPAGTHACIHLTDYNGGTTTGDVDWIYQRKYTATEPVISLKETTVNPAYYHAQYLKRIDQMVYISGSDTLLFSANYDTSIPASASLTGADTLLLTLPNTSSITATLTGSDSLLLTLSDSVALTALLSGSDTLLLTLSNTGTVVGEYKTSSDSLLISIGESVGSLQGLISGTDALLLTVADAVGSFASTSSDTLLITLGTEHAVLTAAHTSSDTLLIDPDIESVVFQALLSGSDTLLIDPDYDSAALVGNALGACEAPVRYIHAKVKITFSDPALNEAVEMLAEGGIAYNTDPTDTADNIIGSAYKWASCQECILDGTYHPMPASVGYWSTSVSDANGDFSTPVDFTVYMTDARPIYDLKIYGDDKLDNYPVDFVITLYDADSVLLHTETVTGNASYAWTKTLDTYVNNVKSMKVSISKISKANRSCIITEFFTAYGEWYYRDKIMFLSVLEERDYKGGTLPIGNVSANELVLRLSNIDKHFSPDNKASPIYNLMKKNRRIEAWIGIEVPIAEADYGAEPEWTPLGIFWSQDWSVPQDEAYAEVVGLDRLELLRTTEFYSSQIYQNYTLYDLAEVVLQDAGLQSSEYSIHADLDAVTIPYAWFGRTTHRTALIEIAEAALATVYCARDGKIVIDPYSDETSPSYTLSSDRYFTKDSPLAFSEIVNYVEVRATPRVLAASLSDIYTETETFSVPAAVGGVPGTTTRFCIFDTDGDPCMDVQTPTFTQSASGISIYSHTDYTWATEIVFQNASAVAENVTSVTIQGKILSKEGEKIAIAEDANSIRLNGKQALQEPVQNDFIQSKARAQDIADALLAAYKDPRRDVVIQARGYTMSKLGERMTVQSLDGAFSDDYTITRQKLEYDGGMEVEMTGQKIPEGS
ncbi:MAG: hypothetical protein BWY93_01536 [Euryarchaeota archaeon ADurb.BinA087]|nr:MAG: hypothetical protein BWY93_01536 [Euryarchaeota archaeon ADurb.BinA087]